jgi:hypothetical protein
MAVNAVESPQVPKETPSFPMFSTYSSKAAAERRYRIEPLLGLIRYINISLSSCWVIRKTIITRPSRQSAETSPQFKGKLKVSCRFLQFCQARSAMKEFRFC